MQSHIQINEYRDRVVLVSLSLTTSYFGVIKVIFSHLHIFAVANCIKKVWATNNNWREGFGYDWPKTFSTEPNKGKTFWASLF